VSVIGRRRLPAGGAFFNRGRDVDEGSGEGDAPRKWPPYVRVLAVSYMLSYPVEGIAFLALTGTAAFLYGLRHPLDGLIVGLGLSGFAAVILCHAYRWWFLRWGRKHYPPADGETESE
jgi:hypothetical protein